MKLQQKQTAQQQLEDMYGKNLSATLSAMGLQPGTLGQWTNADNATNSAISQGFNDFSGASKTLFGV